MALEKEALPRDIKDVIPVFDFGQFGEELVLYFAGRNTSDVSGILNASSQGLLVPVAPSISGVATMSQALVVNTQDQDKDFAWDFLMDMACWLLKFSIFIVTSNTQTAGVVTYDSTRVRLQLVRGGRVIKSLADRTYTVNQNGARTVATGDHFGIVEKLEMHDVLRLLVTVRCDTDAAGAGAAQMQMNLGSASTSQAIQPHIEIHLHPDASHGQVMYKNRKIG